MGPLGHAEVMMAGFPSMAEVWIQGFFLRFLLVRKAG